jgi:replicative DNA helicase
MEGFELYSLEAETAFVGSFFSEPELLKECTIRPEQLYSPRLRQLYRAIRSLDEKGKPIDEIALIEELGPQGMEGVGGVSYVMGVKASLRTTANFGYYQKLVLEYAQKRRVIQITEKIIENTKETDITKTLNEAIQGLMAVEQEQIDDDSGEIKNSLIDLYIDCEKDLGEIVGIPSGFHFLDRLTGGFQESDLVIIGARPSMGKTAFALNIALNAAREDISLFFSFEMSKKQLLKRLAGLTGKIDSLKMKNPKREFHEEDWQNFSDAIGKMTNINLHIFDRACMDVAYIWSKVRKIRREYGGEKRILVVIDYLQLIEGDQKSRQFRQAEISEISRRLKMMARELNVVVIALSQLSRGVESRQDKRPILSDLRESGQIEQDADLIAFLYRDDYYSKDSPEKDKLEVILAKHRNGPTGTVELGFHKSYGKFVNLV